MAALVFSTDSIVLGIDVYKRQILGSEVVEGDDISHYGALACEQDPGDPRLLIVKDMVEKPKPQDAPSQNAIIGRYILTPRIFSLLEQLQPGAGGELQLTDGIKALLQHEKVYGFHYEGKRHDAGEKLGFLKATVQFALELSLIHICILAETNAI